MEQEVSIKEPLKTLVAMTPSFALSLYFSVIGDNVFWYFTIAILIIVIYFSYKDKDKKRLICFFDKGVIHFPLIGRQLKVNEIDKVDVYKSKLTFLYVIKIYSNAYDDDILKVKVTKKQYVTLMLKLFKNINVNQSIIGVKI